MATKKKKNEVPETPKPWSISQTDLDQTNPLEIAWGTTRCLPSEEGIPRDFWPNIVGYRGNTYLHLVDALFCGDSVPDVEFSYNEGFTGNKLMEFTMAHLRSFEPSHEHKIAGLAFMLSKIITFKESSS